MQEMWVWSLGLEDPLEEKMATHSGILAWKTPWTEDPGGLQSMGLQTIRHNWACTQRGFGINIVKSNCYYKMNYKSLEGTDSALLIFSTIGLSRGPIGEGNGNPLQYSCLENPMDGGAWWAAVHGVAKSRTQLSDFTFTFHFPALEEEMATHSSVLAWRIPGTGESGGLPSMESHRVGHDWSDLAAAAGAL